MQCLIHVLALPRLEVLTLSGNVITDQGLSQIARMRNLKNLDLEATEITDAGLVYIEGMKNLEAVNLGATRVTKGQSRSSRWPGRTCESSSTANRWSRNVSSSAGVPVNESSPEESPDRKSPAADSPAMIDFSIRPARPDDAELLVNLVRELAVYEKLEQYALATPDDFREHLFGPHPAAEAAVAEVGGEPAGFALGSARFRRSAAGRVCISRTFS